MRIAVTDVRRTFGGQTGTYAEYRIFSSLARFSNVVGDVDVTLASIGDGTMALCDVSVIVGDRTCVHARASERHACDAIDRAAQRIAQAVARHAKMPASW